ncbi:hypothetical protein F4556_003805 [Kitasatospora gansuensis]|uniref:DUF1453 domain-containing protein n=1 Tax=Kitasatospora gansuensis TaxID=258050 RepID=A0A7W7WIV2_9ACTN|nr:hypothetical protein [Kitasatospora gansuensis]MBB4948270.1 hypothetical protein [Kitasatospora gansuensis]
MTATDYVISAALVLLVIPQIRGTRLTVLNLLIPLALVAAAAAYYLKGIPTQGNDVQLDLVTVAAGAVIGVGCALSTRLQRGSTGEVIAKAGVLAAALWIVGMLVRAVFVYAVYHGYGAEIADFSREQQITGAEAWTAALVLMALAQVVARLLVLRLRARQVVAV